MTGYGRSGLGRVTQRVAIRPMPLCACALVFWLAIYGFFPDNLFVPTGDASWPSFNTAHGLAGGLGLLILAAFSQAWRGGSRIRDVLGASCASLLSLVALAAQMLPGLVGLCGSSVVGVMLGLAEAGIAWWAFDTRWSGGAAFVDGESESAPPRDVRTPGSQRGGASGGAVHGKAQAYQCRTLCALELTVGAALGSVLAFLGGFVLPRMSFMPFFAAGIIILALILLEVSQREAGEAAGHNSSVHASGTVSAHPRSMLEGLLYILPLVPAALVCGVLSVVGVGTLVGSGLQLDGHSVIYLGFLVGSILCVACLLVRGGALVRIFIVVGLVLMATALLAMPHLGKGPVPAVEGVVCTLFSLVMLLYLAVSLEHQHSIAPAAAVAGVARACLVMGMWLCRTFGVSSGTDMTRYAFMWFALGYLVLLGALALTARLVADSWRSGEAFLGREGLGLYDDGTGSGPVSDASPNEDTVSARCSVLAAAYSLSPREGEVLRLLARGRDVATIAERLGISENTVREYVKGVYGKLDVHSRQQIIDLVECESQD